MPDLYKVVISRDGCVNWDIMMPGAVGTHHNCLKFIAHHDAPKGTELGLQDVKTGRLVSYMVTKATGYRCRRIKWLDLKVR